MDSNPSLPRRFENTLLAGMGCLILVAACSPDQESGRNGSGEATPPKPYENIIDVHAHLHPLMAATTMAIMELAGIQRVVNVSGGAEPWIWDIDNDLRGLTNGRLLWAVNVDWTELDAPGWAAAEVQRLRRAKAAGALMWKIPKGLGLGYRHAGGALLAIDDPLLDPLWRAAGELSLPVIVHTADPWAFFRPSTPDNERSEELSLNPDWSFYGEDYPPLWDLFLARERVLARHPETTFILAHLGSAPEDPAYLDYLLATYPNVYLDTAARVGEIGRHPAREMQLFFERWQDRIVFGTDLMIMPGEINLGAPDQIPITRETILRFYHAHWLYFETSLPKLAHPTPIQGRWTVDGIGLPPAVLEKIYYRNAEKVLGL